MEELFVPYNLALLAKDKGFNEECIAYFDPDKKFCFYPLAPLTNSGLKNDEGYFSAPLYQQLIDWFREKDRIDINISCNYERNTWYFGYCKHGYGYHNNYTNKSENYYEALNQALEESFKLI